MTDEIKAATDEDIEVYKKHPPEYWMSANVCYSLIARIEADKAEIERLRECVEDMAWQFSSRGKVGGVENINTMGLSALENAFDILGWPDPKPIGESH